MLPFQKGAHELREIPQEHFRRAYGLDVSHLLFPTLLRQGFFLLPAECAAEAATRVHLMFFIFSLGKPF